MNPDKVCSITISCAVLHNIAIQWKQPLLEDGVSDDAYPDDVVDLKRLLDIWHQDIIEINFLSIISATKFPLYNLYHRSVYNLYS